ncbi:MAG: hypothetical protein AABX93_01965 [Nanoarchaeota archaeon]
MKNLIDYAKCVKENKLALVGYLSMFGFAGTMFLEKDMLYQVFYAGLWANPIGYGMIFSQAGIPTFEAYKRTKRHIKKHGEVDERFTKIMEEAYCLEKGYKLAVKECLLEGDRITSQII